MSAFSPTPMSQTFRVAVQVAAGPAGIAAAADSLARFVVAAGFDPESAWPIHVALDEVLSNIVRHGGVPGRAPQIDVTFAALEDGLELTIVDDGPEFDPLQAPEPDFSSPVDQRQPGGLGVHLVKHLMDKVVYARREERNSLVITCRARAVGPPDRAKERSHGHPPGTP